MPSRHHRRPPSALLCVCALALACGKAESSGNEGLGDGGEPQAPGSSAVGEVLAVEGVLAREPATCEARLDDASALLPQGVLDRSLASSYTNALVVRSDFDERVQLTGAEINLTTTAGQPLFPPFRPTTTGFVDPNSTTLVFVLLLPATIVAELPLGKVVAKVSANGRTSTGKTMTSSAATFPIDVCEGCLVSYPEAARDPQSPNGEYRCKTGVAAAESLGSEPLPCELGIDLPAPCTACSDLLSICQSPANNPSR